MGINLVGVYALYPGTKYTTIQGVEKQEEVAVGYWTAAQAR